MSDLPPQTFSPTAMKFLEEWKASGNKLSSEQLQALLEGDFASELGLTMLKAAGVLLD